ncbi:MAG: DedA family protein [Leptonema sp. (in: bacteria)]
MFSTFTENVFPPWPGDTFIVFSGFLMYHQILNPIWVYFFTTIGNFLGAFLMYFLGETILEFAHRFHKKVKIEFLRNLLETMISEEQKIKTERIFEKWGFWFVLVSRFSAGIRYFVSIIAGITKMNLSIFSFAFFVAVLIWNTILLLGGYILAENWEKALEWLRVYNYTIGILILVVVIFLFYRFFINKKEL